MRMRKRRKFLIPVAVFLLVLAVWVLWGSKALQLNAHTHLSPDLPEAFDGYRIAHISDLHNAQMGRDNAKLLALLEQAQPDMIAMTGDLIDSRRTDVQVALDFVAQAVKIAPCYYVTGNHEARISEYTTLRDGLLDLGVTVLEDSLAVIERGGQTISVLGVNDPNFYTDDNMTSRLQPLTEGQDGYALLLSHRPELFSTYVQSGVDLVLSGHAHGGQFRLPFVGGLIAPHQGFFPEYDSGLYTQGGTSMLVSRGIGNSLFPLRFNNRPEVLLITLHRA